MTDLPLFNYAAQARQESYGAIGPKIGARQQEVLDLLKAHIHGLGAWEIAERLNRPVYICRPRITELAKEGHIEQSGMRFHEGTQRNEAVWKVAQ